VGSGPTSRATVAGESVQTIRLSLQGNGGEIRGISVCGAAATRRAKCVTPEANAYDGQLRADVRLIN
jgi:hypothetical protein